MQELDFSQEACMERWTKWDHSDSDGDSASCCKTYDINDPIHVKVIKHGYIKIDFTSPLSDYSYFNGRTDSSCLSCTGPQTDEKFESTSEPLKIAA